MAVSTHIIVDAPPPRPPRYSLVGAAEATPSAERWIAGVDVLPFPPGPARTWAECVGSQLDSEVKESNTLLDVPGFDAFTVYLQAECTTVGFTELELLQRVRLVYDVYELSAIEAEFWTGEREPQNPHLDDGNATVLGGGGAKTIVEGFALLEDAIAATGKGGMIHCTPGLATAAFDHFLIVEDGRGLRTHMGTPVVPGYGYPGTGTNSSSPGAGNTVAYATGPVVVRRGTVIPFDQPAQVIDREANTLIALVERDALAYWDGELQASALIDLTS